MKPEYQKWIEHHVADKGTGKCKEITQAMQEAFPELRLIRGHYYCLVWGEREHWWLVDVDGSIVDPTAAQFPSKGGRYEALADDTPEPTGKCPNCGEYCYGSGECCSEACHKSYVAYLMNGIL